MAEWCVRVMGDVVMCVHVVRRDVADMFSALSL